MSLSVTWASNAMLQPTGYGRIARELLPRLQEQSDHTFSQFCVTGLENTMPFDYDGIPMFGRSPAGGNLGVLDFPRVHSQVNADVWALNFDAWAISAELQHITQRRNDVQLSYVLYPPIDHDPLSNKWLAPLNNARSIIPYCQFGERVIREAVEDGRLDAGVGGRIAEPIYHGVDTGTFRPQADLGPSDVFGRRVDDDQFVVGIYKNNQGTRSRIVDMMDAFGRFLEKADAAGEAVLYIHSTIQGRDGYDLQEAVARLGLDNHVLLVDQAQRQLGINDDDLCATYNACDVVLNTVAGEGFGLPIIESFASGTPVIGGAFSSMPELLGTDEGEWVYREGQERFTRTDRGWLVPVYDREYTPKNSYRCWFNTDHIADALLDAYRHPDKREARGRAAREWVLQYDWDRIASQWQRYFDELERDMFQTDDQGIEWETVPDAERVSGGVGALGGKRNDG